MSVQYNVRESFLVSGEGYIAQILPGKRLETKDIVERMAKKGTTLTKTDLRAAFTILREVIMEAMKEGYQINFIDFMSLTFSIGGMFEGDEDSFSPDRHELKIRANISKTFCLDVLRHVTLEKRVIDKKGPIITSLSDLASKIKNSFVTQGKLAVLRGDYLKFDQYAEDEGIYFFSEDKSKMVKVAFEGRLATKEIMFIVPDLSSLGPRVYVELRTKLNSKSIRTNILDKLLEVK